MGWGMQRDGERGMQRGGDGEWTPRGRSVSQWGVRGGCGGLTAPGLALAGRGLICPRSCEGARPERLSRTSRGDSRDHTDGTAPLSHGSPAAPGRWERARVGPPRIWGACGRGLVLAGLCRNGGTPGLPLPGAGATLLPRGVQPCPGPISPLSARPSALPVPPPRPAPAGAPPCCRALLSQSLPVPYPGALPSAPPLPVHPRCFCQRLLGASPAPSPVHARSLPRPPGASPGPLPALRPLPPQRSPVPAALPSPVAPVPPPGPSPTSPGHPPAPSCCTPRSLPRAAG